MKKIFFSAGVAYAAATVGQGKVPTEELSGVVMDMPGASDLWKSGKTLYHAVKCRGLTDCQECKKAGCNFCQMGPAGVLALNHFVSSKVTDLLTQEEKDTANICGLVDGYCQEFDDWMSGWIDYLNAHTAARWSVSMYEQLTGTNLTAQLPQFNPCGDPDAAGANLALPLLLSVFALAVSANI